MGWLQYKVPYPLETRTPQCVCVYTSTSWEVHTSPQHVFFYIYNALHKDQICLVGKSQHFVQKKLNFYDFGSCYLSNRFTQGKQNWHSSAPNETRTEGNWREISGKETKWQTEKPQDREIVDHVQQFNLNRKLDDLGARCNSCTELNTEILQILKEKLRKT